MLSKKQVTIIKSCLVLVALSIIFLFPTVVPDVVRKFIVVGFVFLLTILNYYAEENSGLFKRRRDNLLFELLLVFLLFLTTWYVS